jgi:hypothetical protein
MARINEINAAIQHNHLNDRDVHQALKTIAWECIKKDYYPVPASREVVLNALSTSCDAERLLYYLEVRLQSIRVLEPAKEDLIITLDPLTEYLAALKVIEMCDGNLELWDDYLAGALGAGKRSNSVSEFFVALRHCCAIKCSKEESKLVLPQLDQLISKSRTSLHPFSSN